VCRTWGELEIIEFLPQHPEHPEVLHIKSGKDEKGYENVWHSDVTWREKPSFGSMLRAEVVPEVGGDTMFCDMYVAYNALPSSIKRAVEGMEAVHSVANGLKYTQGTEKMNEMLKKYPMQVHPVIRTHPETGKKGIYVNRAHTSHVSVMAATFSWSRRGESTCLPASPSQTAKAAKRPESGRIWRDQDRIPPSPSPRQTMPRQR
jgi:taurine dioxygenase